MAKVHTVAHLPDDPAIIREWVQHVRNFDATHKECLMQVFGETSRTCDEIEQALNTVEPKLMVTKVKR